MYKFDPTKHGFEPISNFPELQYRFPLNNDVWFIKVVAYVKLLEPVYWYHAISLSMALHGDDRIKIVSGAHDFRRPNEYEQQGTLHTNYMGLITSDEFAKELLTHLMGTTQNASVLVEGKTRYEQNLGSNLRKEFPEFYKNNSHE